MLVWRRLSICVPPRVVTAAEGTVLAMTKGQTSTIGVLLLLVLVGVSFDVDAGEPDGQHHTGVKDRLWHVG